MVIDIGTVCMKIAGREGGKLCTVIKKLDKTFVLATGPKLLTGVKRRKVNINHIEPTEYRLEIKEDATDEEVIEAYKKANLVTRFNLKLPSAAEMKPKETKPKATEETKEVKAKEEKK